MTDGLAIKARRIAEIIDRNLYHQDEKVEDAKALAIELADELSRIHAEIAKTEEDALGYATRLVTLMAKKHYPDGSPDWKPLPDVVGILTQIDNMLSGMVRAETAKNSGEVVACEKCSGEGKLYTSKYGGNDPDVWPIGTCDECEGSGVVEMEPDMERDLSSDELDLISQSFENYKTAIPVAKIINDNQPGKTAIIEILCEPPTLGIGTELYVKPVLVRSSDTNSGQFFLATPANSRARNSGEPVAYQRRFPNSEWDWIECRKEDIAHYQGMGQEVRALYLAALATQANSRALADYAAPFTDDDVSKIKHDAKRIASQWDSATPANSRAEADERIENATQAASETHQSWKSRCYAILAALNLDFGDNDEPTLDEVVIANSRAEAIGECITYLEALPECELKSTSAPGDFQQNKLWWANGARAQKRAMLSQLRALLATEGH